MKSLSLCKLPTEGVSSPRLYKGSIGIMEKKMETLGPFKGIYRGYIGVIWGFYRDNGKENGSYYLGFRVLPKTRSHFRSS